MSGEVRKSTFQQAADLPAGVPHILSVLKLDAGNTSEGVAAVIDVDELEDSLRAVKDPTSAAGYFALEADAYRRQLRREGRSA